MIDYRQLKGLLILLISFCSVAVHAVTKCESKTQITAGLIEPVCQQTSMRGLWWAIPGKMIPPELIEQYEDDAIALKVPSYWPENQLNLNADYPRGVITLWADIKLSGQIASGENLSLWPGRFRSAMRVYVHNGKGSWTKAYDNLSIFLNESDKITQSLPAIGTAGKLHNGTSFQLPRLYPGSRVVVQLYVDDYRTGGLAQPIQIGLTDELNRNIVHRASLHILFLGASLLIAIFAGSQAYFSSNSRAKYLFFVVMSLGTGIRLLVTGNLLTYIFPNLTVNDHIYLAWTSFLFLLGIFVGIQVFILPRIFRRFSFLKSAFLFLSFIPVLLLLSIPFLSKHEFLLIGHFLRTFYVSVSFAYAIFLVWQVWLYPKGQWLQLLGIMVIIIGGSIDTYLYSQNLDPYIEMFAIAMFIFIGSQAIHFGWKHMRLLSRTQQLTLNLKELNDSLEKQVRSRTLDLQIANKRLSVVAATDVLTDLPNRRAYDNEIDDEVLKAKNEEQKFCLAIVDVDWFKSVNDRFGHDFGDKVLQILATFLRNKLRTSDFVARIGGEEFAIILPLTDISSADIVLNNLCTEVTQLRIDDTKDYHLSISIGCAQWQEGISIDHIYSLADKALYKAKHNGRGRVELAN